jgi:hypothetical protein
MRILEVRFQLIVLSSPTNIHSSQRYSNDSGPDNYLSCSENLYQVGDFETLNIPLHSKDSIVQINYWFALKIMLPSPIGSFQKEAAA